MRQYLWYRRRRRLIQYINGWVIFFLILFLAGSFAAYVNNVMIPVIKTMAEMKVRAAVTQAVQGSIQEAFSGGMKYEELVLLQKDQNNNVIAVQSNVVRMNQISSEIAMKVQEKLSVMRTENLKIPMGVLFGYDILNTTGPNFNLNVIPIGSVEADFRSDLSEAGINQTRHRIIVEIKSKFRIVLPLISEEEEMITSVPVAETVIVGNVPGTYLNWESKSNK